MNFSIGSFLKSIVILIELKAPPMYWVDIYVGDCDVCETVALSKDRQLWLHPRRIEVKFVGR